jgi:IclR family acetate operon transcriptional repressor
MNLVQFRQELEIIRKQGYAVDDEETTLGARCVSAPILGAEREVMAALSVSGPVTRISPSQVPVVAQAVINAARAISLALGLAHSNVEATAQSDETVPSTVS